MVNSLLPPVSISVYNATKAILPDEPLWFCEQGLRLGRDYVIRHATCEGRDRLGALLAIAFRRRLPPHQLRVVTEAAAHSRRGDQVLANLRLAFADLSRIPASQDLEKRIEMADTLLDSGMTADELLHALDLDVFSNEDLGKFDPDQPRVPAGHGADSGRWAGVDGAAGVATLVSSSIGLRAAPLLAPELGAATMGALTALAGIVGLAAVGGVLFVPWQKSVSSSGLLPGNSGTSYSYNSDEGLLRVLDATGEVLAAGHKDGSGVFFDADTGIPFAREINGSVIFDDAAMEKPSGQPKPEDKSDPRGILDDDQPKLCPAPGPDQPGSEAASKQAKAYQEQISRMINPQRPLEYGLAMNLINPVTGKIVHFDECDEKTGTMIDAKGPSYAGLLRFEPAFGNITEEWLKQSALQISAARTRRVEWYFAEQSAADYARDLFADRDEGRERIIIKVQPAERP